MKQNESDEAIIKQRNKVGLLISLIILIGIAAIVFFSFTTCSKIIKDDVLNISKLTSTNIYSEINNELTKPIFVSLTMANDSFVKQWLEQEDSQKIRKLLLIWKALEINIITIQSFQSRPKH